MIKLTKNRNKKKVIKFIIIMSTKAITHIILKKPWKSEEFGKKLMFKELWQFKNRICRKQVRKIKINYFFQIFNLLSKASKNYSKKVCYLMIKDLNSKILSLLKQIIVNKNWIRPIRLIKPKDSQRNLEKKNIYKKDL